MSAPRREGSRPEVEEANGTPGSAARLAAASSSSLTSSRSGALSCTKPAPSTASSGVAAIVSDPSGGSGASVSRAYARRALPIVSASLRPASGSGS